MQKRTTSFYLSLIRAPPSAFDFVRSAVCYSCLHKRLICFAVMLRIFTPDASWYRLLPVFLHVTVSNAARCTCICDSSADWTCCRIQPSSKWFISKRCSTGVFPKVDSWNKNVSGSGGTFTECEEAQRYIAYTLRPTTFVHLLIRMYTAMNSIRSSVKPQELLDITKTRDFWTFKFLSRLLGIAVSLTFPIAVLTGSSYQYYWAQDRWLWCATLMQTRCTVIN